MSPPSKPRSPERPTISRARTLPSPAPPETNSHVVHQPKRRPENARSTQAVSSRDFAFEQVKDPSDIWADAAGTVVDSIVPTPKPTPRRRPRDREPLALRTVNVDSRSSSATATLGTKPSMGTIADGKEGNSRSSSTAGTLGSKRPSLETDTEQFNIRSDDAKRKTTEDKKRNEMSSERQAAARKRLEERKRAKQRAAAG